MAYQPEWREILYDRDKQKIADNAQTQALEYLLKTHAVKVMDIDGHEINRISAFHIERMLEHLEDRK